MINLFGEPWPGVQLAHIRGFLDDAGEEGITWEAKADDDEERKPPEGEAPGRLRPATIRKAACGLANQIGGYLILGARWDKQEGRWRLPGILIPDDEPELWLGKVLRALGPVPRFDPKAWTLDDDRTVAVVRVDPVSEPPCMTPQGHVYERVSGETIRVTDPTVLEALFRRGRHARERAELFANRAALRALDAPRWRWQRAAGISLALAPIGRETDDITSRLFVPSFREAIVKSTWAFFQNGHPLRSQLQPDSIETWQQQDAFSVFGHFHDRHVLHPGGAATRQHATTWLVQASWDGAVAASATFTQQSMIGGHSGPTEVILPAWRELAALVERLGGYGPAHLAVVVHASREYPEGHTITMDDAVGTPPPPPPHGSIYRRLSDERTSLGRWVTVGEPDGEVLASLQRELERAAGTESYEPEREATE